MNLQVELLPFQLLMVFLAGFFGAVAGGGGFMTLPVILAAGLSPQMALGTNKMLATFATFPSAMVFIGKGFFSFKRWLKEIIATCIGTAFGVLTIQLFSANFLKMWIPILVIGLSIHSVFYEPNKKLPIKIVSRDPKSDLSLSVILAVLLGFYSGFIGIGLGVFWTSIIMRLYKCDILEAAGISRPMCLLSNSTAFMLFMFFGHVDYLLGCLMGISMSCGSFVGANLAIKFGIRFIKLIILVVSVAMSIHLILEY